VVTWRISDEIQGLEFKWSGYEKWKWINKALLFSAAFLELEYTTSLGPWDRCHVAQIFNVCGKHKYLGSKDIDWLHVKRGAEVSEPKEYWLTTCETGSEISELKGYWLTTCETGHRDIWAQRILTTCETGHRNIRAQRILTDYMWNGAQKYLSSKDIDWPDAKRGAEISELKGYWLTTCETGHRNIWAQRILTDYMWNGAHIYLSSKDIDWPDGKRGAEISELKGYWLTTCETGHRNIWAQRILTDYISNGAHKYLSSKDIDWPDGKRGAEISELKGYWLTTCETGLRNIWAQRILTGQMGNGAQKYLGSKDTNWLHVKRGSEMSELKGYWLARRETWHRNIWAQRILTDNTLGWHSASNRSYFGRNIFLTYSVVVPYSLKAQYFQRYHIYPFIHLSSIIK
jgi:rhodanese-related sulfurtransferase